MMVDNVEQVGNQAYQKSLWGDHKGAVALLSKAITRHPFDKRLYNDRSYYYHKLRDYKNALHDAESMLKLFPTYTRGHFRKGEVLLDMKKYEEAELVFRDLLRLDPDNKEAKFYLLESQISELTKGRKHYVRDARRALELNNFNTNQAKTFLENRNIVNICRYDKSEIYYSDEDEDDCLVGRFNSPKRTCNHGAGDQCSNDDEYDPFMDPSNPFQSNSLWVGNITSKVTEQNLEPLFSKFGKIKSIFVHHKQSCAFVNYMHPSMATNAMRKFQQSLPFEDTFLVIRFPESSKSKTVPSLGLKAYKKGYQL